MISLSKLAHGGTYREARAAGVADVIALRKDGEGIRASSADGWFLAMGRDWNEAARLGFAEKGFTI